MIDLIPIGLAFLLGSFVSLLKLPPLIGFIAAGFFLADHWQGQTQNLQHFADLGVTILLFSIGLKLHLKSLSRKEVFVPALGNFVSYFLFLLLILFFIRGSEQLFSSSLIAFSLTFSSTVFVVKLLEKRGDEKAIYGRSSIGILVIQDIIAVLFLAATAKKIPSVYAIVLLGGLIPIKYLLSKLLAKIERGELILLFGIFVALGGSYLFELVKIKGDLGALIFGMLLASHMRSKELYKELLSFKNFFLLAFFLSIGLYGTPTLEQSLIALAICCLLPIKGVLFYIFYNKLGLRARISYLGSMSLQNFSEFGLIVMSLAVSSGWLEKHWVSIFALVVSFSFIYSSIMDSFGDRIYSKLAPFLKNKQNKSLHDLESSIALGDANVLIIGMGRIGRGAYKEIDKQEENIPISFDYCPINHKRLLNKKINIIFGDATSIDFWDRVELQNSNIKTVLLAMPKAEQNKRAIELLREKGFKGIISTVAKFPDEEKMLRETGANNAFNLYSEAGIGLAESIRQTS